MQHQKALTFGVLLCAVNSRSWALQVFSLSRHSFRSSSISSKSRNDNGLFKITPSCRSARLSPSLTLFESTDSRRDDRCTTSNILIRDYLELIRPVTLLQAVGALVVGSLTIGLPSSLQSLTAASMSVYLSYGAGMVANDCVDSTLDAKHKEKCERPIPSGRIPLRQAWNFTAILSALSLILSNTFVNRPYGLWTASNLALMLGYALGWQKLFLVKNFIVGYLGISPLVGAVLLSATRLDKSTNVIAVPAAKGPLLRLASVGFAVGVAREILKDAEDTDVDWQFGNKRTLPQVVGERASHRIAFGLVTMACVACLSPGYRALFASPPIPCYLVATALGTTLCARASILPLQQGQRLLKKSIYLLLAGMISSLLLQQR